MYSDTWDIEGHHGNYQSTKSFKSWDQYCKKDQDYIVFGEFDPDAYRQANMKKTAYISHRIIKEGAITDDLLDEHPDILLNYEKYSRGLKLLQRDRATARVVVAAPPQWYPWQETLLNLLKLEPDARRVHWIYDEEGNKGKSFITKYLVTSQGAFFADGKRDDVLYAYAGQRIVILDLAREKEDQTYFYGTIEKIKNGCYFTGKYESRYCVWDTPHVIVFANWPPDQSKLSADRWDIWRLNSDRAITGGDPAWLQPQLDAAAAAAEAPADNDNATGAEAGSDPGGAPELPESPIPDGLLDLSWGEVDLDVFNSGESESEEEIVPSRAKRTKKTLFSDD